MQRTKIITIVLLGAAASAVSGCVAVPAGPTPVPSRQAGRHTPDVEPQIVQRPAKEALETVSPAASPHHREAKPHTEAPPARPSGAPRSGRVAEPPRAGPLHSKLPRLRVPQPLPKNPVPVPPAAKVDVCALGEGYGHWQPDSPQARICRQTYRNR